MLLENIVVDIILKIDRNIVNDIPANQVISFEQQVFPKLILEGNLFGYISKKRFYDIGTPERLALAMEVLL